MKAMRNFLDSLAKIMALFRKELLTILKDRSSRSLLIAPALMQALLYGYGATYDLTNVPYAVLDQSRAAASTELIARLEGTGVFHRVATTAPKVACPQTTSNPSNAIARSTHRTALAHPPADRAVAPEAPPGRQ